MQPCVVCFADDATVPVDFDQDGRVSQGYIFIGESHVGMYMASFFDSFSCVRKDLRTCDGRPIRFFGNGDAYSVAPEGDSAIWTVSSPHIEDVKDPLYLLPGGKAYGMAKDIVSANKSIEHWNLIVCWGTNIVETKDAGVAIDAVESSLIALKSEFPGTSTSVFYAVPPAIDGSVWKNKAQERNLDALSDRILDSEEILSFDLRDWAGSHSWNAWQQAYRNMRKSGRTKLPNDFLLGSAPDAKKWDGMHVSANAYQDVFGSLVQHLEDMQGRCALHSADRILLPKGKFGRNVKYEDLVKGING